VKLAVYADRREGRRQCAGRQDASRRDFTFPAVEVAHHTRTDMRSADRKPRFAAVGQGKVNQLGKRLFERRGGIETSLLRSEINMRTEEGERIRLEES